MKNTNSKGITLIALVITIIILTILASVATYSGSEAIKYSRFTVFKTELKIMQTHVNSLYDKWKNDEQVNGKNILQLGDEILTTDKKAQTAFLGAKVEDKSGYRFFSQETIKSLDIEGIDREFLINIEKRSIISYEGFKYDEELYYTLNQFSNELYNVDYQPNTSERTNV